MPAVTLALDSYEFGFENPTTIGGATGGSVAGKVKFDELTISSRWSGVSPQLFKVFASGSHYATAVLARISGSDVTVGWVLGTVFMTSNSIHGTSTAVPTETLTMIFGSITAATSGHTTAWDQILNRNDGPDATGNPLVALPTMDDPALTLEFQSTNPSVPALTLALNSYHFGFENPTTIRFRHGRH